MCTSLLSAHYSLLGRMWSRILSEQIPPSLGLLGVFLLHCRQGFDTVATLAFPVPEPAAECLPGNLGRHWALMAGWSWGNSGILMTLDLQIKSHISKYSRVLLGIECKRPECGPASELPCFILKSITHLCGQ